MSSKIELMTNRTKKSQKIKIPCSANYLLFGKTIENWLVIKKADDEYFRMVFSYFRAWSFILALYMIEGQKVKKNLCTFLLSTSQGDYNTTLAGPWKPVGFPLSEPILLHYICLGNSPYLQDEGKKKQRGTEHFTHYTRLLHEKMALSKHNFKKLHITYKLFQPEESSTCWFHSE